MNSIWEKDAERPIFKGLDGDIKTDVLIIGGGICGILCAFMLKKAGVDCVLAEADKICGSTTGYTTAKITFQHGAFCQKFIKKYGEEKAMLYVKAQTDAIQEYRKLCSEISCDFKESDSFVYSRTDREIIEKEAHALCKIGCDAVFFEKTALPFSVAGAVGVKNQAEFNPLKFCFSIAKDLKIYENTRITELTPTFAATDKGKIYAKKIIVATHFPFINKHGSYFIKMYQHRSYVTAFKNAPTLNGMYVDEDIKGLSFRNYKGYLLLGGGSHRTGKQGGGWKELEECSKKYYPDASAVFRWATQDCMTLDGIPYIGQYSKNTPNFYVATGFNKWGMTSSMVAAKILRDQILGKQNDFAEIFSPQRSIIHPQLAINLGESLLGILKPTAPRCPHLGCALKYNKAEHSWDCSCHGSRFTESGKVINNPANKDINNMP